MDDCCQEKLNVPVLQIDHFIQTVPNYADKGNHKPSCTVHLLILRYHHS